MKPVWFKLVFEGYETYTKIPDAFLLALDFS
jgi:hypothetical protein